MTRATAAVTTDVLIGGLFNAFRKVPSTTDLSVYGDACADVPAPLLKAAVKRAIRTRRFLPAVAELLADAEACRQEWLAAHPWKPCRRCQPPGWVLVVDPAGITRLTRCDCWRAYQSSVARQGMERAVIAALPPGHEEEREL